jgi:hypothetical protein
MMNYVPMIWIWQRLIEAKTKLESYIQQIMKSKHDKMREIKAKLEIWENDWSTGEYEDENWLVCWCFGKMRRKFDLRC